MRQREEGALSKLVMLSVLIMNIAIPTRFAADPDPRRGLKRTIFYCAAFNFLYVLSLIYVVPRLLH